MADFKPVRTRDIVLHEGKRYLVTSVDVHATKGALLTLVPLQESYLIVPIASVCLADPVEEHLRKVSRTKSLKRLVAADTARHAWELGLQKVRLSPTVVPLRGPLSMRDMEQRVKTAVLHLARSRTKSQPLITQASLDKLVRRITAAQAYLVGYHRTAIKSNGEDTVASWQDIAAFAVKLANEYNKSVLRRR